MYARPNSRIVGFRHNGRNAEHAGRAGLHNAVQSAGGRPSFTANLMTTIVADIYSGDATPTFTRATTAYQTDFEAKPNAVLSGEVRFQGARRVYNNTLRSETLTAAAGWTVTNCASVQGATAPDGTATAWTVTATGNAAALFKGGALAPVGTGTSSVYLRRVTGTSQIQIVEPDGGATNITLTSSWRRYSVSGGISGNYVGIGIATSGDVVEMWHPMNEIVTEQTNQNPSEYVPNDTVVYSAPWTGAGVSGVQYFNTLNGNTVAANVVTEATGAAIVAGQAGVSANAPVDANGPYGYLAEGTRIDNALWNRDLTNVAWASGGGGVATAKTATGIDGVTNSATTLTASGADGTLLQSVTLGSQANVFQPFIKRRTGTGTISITLDNGGTWTDVTSQINASTYTLVQATKTAANPIFGFKITTSGDAIDVDFAGLQNGTFASSPIPTTTVAVQRNADSLTYSSTNNYSWPGVIYVETVRSTTAISGGIVVVNDGTTNNRIEIRLSNQYSIIITSGGVDSINTSAGLITANTMFKLAFLTDTNNSDLYSNGSAVIDTSAGAAPASTTIIRIGAITGGGNETYGTIRNVRIYSKALSTAKLQAMTSP